jgi:hypothetical protein
MKSLYSLIFILLISTVINAQQYQLSFHIGHEFGFRPQLSNDVDLNSRVKYSLGNGVTSQLMFNVIPDSANWHFSLGMSTLRGNTILISENFINTFKYEAISKSIVSHRIPLLLNYRFKIKHSSIQIFSGIVIPFYNRIKEEYSMKDSSVFINKEFNVRNYLAIGYQGGVEYNKKINNKFSLCLNAHLNILNQKVKSKELSFYSDNEFNNIDFISDRSNREFLYKKEVTEIQNNESFLPRGFNKNLPTDLLTYTETLSSFGLSFGLKYQF